MAGLTLTPQQLDKLFSIALQQFVFVEEDTVHSVQYKAFGIQFQIHTSNIPFYVQNFKV